jgi:hypothetical protein
MLSCISLFAYPTIFYVQEYLLLFFFSVPLYLYLLHCRFWTHIVMAYAFTFWTCYVLLREYEKVAAMRLQFLSSERRRPDQFTVRWTIFLIDLFLFRVFFPQPWACSSISILRNEFHLWIFSKLAVVVCLPFFLCPSPIQETCIIEFTLPRSLLGMYLQIQMKLSVSLWSTFF